MKYRGYSKLTNGVFEESKKFDLNEYSNEIKIFLYLMNIFDFNKKMPINVFTDIYSNAKNQYEKLIKNINIYNTYGEVNIDSIKIKSREKEIEFSRNNVSEFRASTYDLNAVLDQYFIILENIINPLNGTNIEDIQNLSDKELAEYKEYAIESYINDWIAFLSDRNEKFYNKLHSERPLGEQETDTKLHAIVSLPLQNEYKLHVKYLYQDGLSGGSKKRKPTKKRHTKRRKSTKKTRKKRRTKRRR